MRRCGVEALSFGCIHPSLRLPASTVNVHLVQVGSTKILVDAGPPWTGPVLAKILKGRAWHPDIIAITHAHIDHVGGAAFLQRAFPQARLLAHPDDVQTIEEGLVLVPRHITPWTKIRPVVNWAFTLRPMPKAKVDGSLQQLRKHGIVLLSTPGHANPHTSLLLPDGQVLAGDALVVGMRGKAMENGYYEDLEAQRESLQLIADHARGLIHPGHGPSCQPEAVARLVLSFDKGSPSRLAAPLGG